MVVVAIVLSLSHVDSFATPWTVAHQAPLSTGFLRQEQWGGLSFTAPGELSNSGIKFTSSAWQEDFFFFLTTVPPGKTMQCDAQILSAISTSSGLLTL